MTHPSTSYFILKRIWSLTPFLLNTDLKKSEGQTNPQKQHAQIRTNRFTLTKIKLTRQTHSSPAIAGPRTECPISTLPCDKVALNTKSQKSGFGGGRRVRTDDPLLAKQVLSQLSYAPKNQITTHAAGLVVGQGGLEPPTPRLSSVCSNQLSY